MFGLIWGSQRWPCQQPAHDVTVRVAIDKVCEVITSDSDLPVQGVDLWQHGHAIFAAEQVTHVCSVLSLNHAALVQHQGTVNAMAEFSTWMIWFYVSDRTRILPVEVKSYSRDVFLTVFAAVIAIGFGSFRKDKRVVTLSRQQSEEWKGWMQVCTPELCL